MAGVAGGGLESTLVVDTPAGDPTTGAPLPGDHPAPEPEAVLAASAAPADLAAAVARAATVHHPDQRTARRQRIVQRFHVTATFERLFGLYAEVVASAAEGGRIPDFCDREARRTGPEASPAPDPRPTLSYR